MIVVSDTTPLIGLASIQRFDLLKQLFGEIHIPQAVYDEAVVAGREEGGARREVSTAVWVKTERVMDRLASIKITHSNHILVYLSAQLFKLGFYRAHRSPHPSPAT